MKILFIGCVHFSEQALIHLIKINALVIGVITKERSNFNSDFVDLKFLSTQANIPCKYVKDINHPNNILWIKELQPDIIFCFGWSSLLCKDILDIPNMGVVGYHPSELPYNRGRHPLIWAKILGLENTGSTFFFMEEEADSGDILHQDKFEIKFGDDISVIYKNMINTAIGQIDTFYTLLLNGQYKRIKQDKAKANYWRQRFLKDGFIDFRMTSTQIINLIRALTKPFPGAHAMYYSAEIKIWAAEEIELINISNLEPGKILGVNSDEIIVKTGDGAIKLTDHSFTQIPSINEYFS